MSSEIWHKMLKSHRKPSCAAILELMSLGFSKNNMMSDKNVMNNILRAEEICVAQSLNWLVKGNSLKQQFLKIMQTFDIMCLKRHQLNSVQTTDNQFQTNSTFPDAHIFILDSCDNINSDNYPPLSEVIEVNGQKYELRFIGFLRLNVVLSRYGCKQNKWWFFKHFGSGIKMEHSVDNIFRHLDLTQKWSFAIFYLVDDAIMNNMRKKYLHFLSGQTNFSCRKHKFPLTSEVRGSHKLCCMNESGKICCRKAFFSCPVGCCLVSICKKHAGENAENELELVERDPSHDADSESIFSDSTSCSDENDSLLSFDSEEELSDHKDIDTNELSYLTDAGFVDNEMQNNFVDSTDAGSIAQAMISNRNCISMNLFLSADVQPLKRFRGPVVAPIYAKRFLQNLVSTNDLSVPVNSIQAMICPSSYFVSTDIGSYPGAIPTVLLANRNTNEKLGFHGLEEHAVVLLRNHGVAAANDQMNQSFFFDTIVNQKLSQCHTNRLLRGGLSELTTRQYDDSLSGIWDRSQSQRHVRELAASFRHHSPKLFVTLTCNMREHFGVREVFKHLDDSYFKQHYPNLEDDRFLDCSQELRNSVMQSSLVLLTRCWERALRYLLFIITKRHVLGTVRNFWGTHEFQPGRGNLSHFHLLLDCVESREALAKTIACKMRRFNSEIKQFATAHPQLIRNDEEAEQLFNMMAKFQTHDCEKINHACHKNVDNHGEPICRVRKYPSNIIEPICEEIKQTHNVEVWELLEKLGMAEQTNKGFLPEYLACGPIVREKYVYPADNNEHVVPTNVVLTGITRSNSNVLVTTHHMCASYTATYLTLKEKSKVEILSACAHDRVTARVDKIQHDKLPAVQIRLKREAREKRKQVKQEGRLVGQPEIIFFLLRFKYIHTSFTFIHVSTDRKERRSAYRMQNSTSDIVAKIRALAAAPVPKQWKFTADQVITIEDEVASGLTQDKISIFSIRPPQLLFVDEVEKYFRWFVRGNVTKSLLDFNQERAWIDGTERLIKLRVKAREEFVSYAQNRLNQLPENNEECHNIVDCITLIKRDSSLHSVKDDSSASLPVVVFSEVSPLNTVGFLTHIILTLGKYETEYSLFKNFSMVDAFAKAHLINSADFPAEKEVLHLTRRYILQESINKPGGSRTEDRKLLAAYKILHSLLIDKSIVYEECPSILHHSIQQEASDKCRIFETAQIELLITTITSQYKDIVPSYLQLREATRENQLDWRPSFNRCVGQTIDSYTEQSEILQNIVNVIDTYRFAQNNFVPFQSLIGPPGVGKSFLTAILLAYAISKGLRVAVTALAGETAARSGGIYISHLFHIPATNRNENMVPSKIAESALQKLEYDLPKRRFLQSLDVLCVEEIGMICVELWNSMNLILQQVCVFKLQFSITNKIALTQYIFVYVKVRESDLPFGGILVIANGDALQLPPPSGSPIWISTTALVLFNFHFLKEFVRMVDVEGQRLLRLLAKRPLTEDEANEACDIIRKECKFVRSFDSIPRHILRIFGTRAAEAAEVAKHREEILNSSLKAMELSCDDEVLCGTVWKSSKESKSLDNFALEPKSLLLYPGAIMRFTACNAREKQSQGQLCVIEKLPEVKTDPISVLAAPSGMRVVPSSDTETLLNLGFYRTKVFFKVGYAHKIGSVSKSIIHSTF